MSKHGERSEVHSTEIRNRFLAEEAEYSMERQKQRQRAELDEEREEDRYEPKHYLKKDD